MKITKEKNEMIIKVPLTTKRCNPYMEDEEQEDMPNIVGLVIHHRKKGHYDESGFAYNIDMSYAGKSDQWSDFFLKLDDEKEVKRLCLEFGLGLVKYED